MKNLISKIMCVVILGSALAGCRGKHHRHHSHSSSSSSDSSSSSSSSSSHSHSKSEKRERDFDKAFRNVPALFADAAEDIFRAYNHGKQIDFNAVITTTADAVSAAITVSHDGNNFTGIASVAKATGAVTNTWNPGGYSASWTFSASELAALKAIAEVFPASTIDGNLKGLRVINPTRQLAAPGSPIVSVEDFKLSAKFVGSNASSSVGKADKFLERILVAIFETATH